LRKYYIIFISDLVIGHILFIYVYYVYFYILIEWTANCFTAWQ